MRAYVSGLSPSEQRAFQAGLHASHFEEALAQGDWDRAAVHAKALGAIAPPQVLEVTSGGVVTMWRDLSPTDQRSILYGMAPIPGLLTAKLLGATWPMAGAIGLLSAPVVMLVALAVTRNSALALSTQTVSD